MSLQFVHPKIVGPQMLHAVAQVVIHLTDKVDFAETHGAFQDVFSALYRTWATIIVAGLTVPKARIEIVANSHFGG